MALYVGCDVGTVGVKVALVTDEPTEPFRQADGLLAELSQGSPLAAGWRVFVLPYRRVGGDPLGASLALLREGLAPFVERPEVGLGVTGSGGKLLSALFGVAHESEYRAVARGVACLYPDVSHIFEIGGEQAKLLAIAPEAADGTVGILDYQTSGDCAAGTGSFLDQQSSRLRFRVEDVGDVALGAARAPTIAGRCSVFAKTDMIHAQQKGAAPEEVLRGLCDAVARNFKGNVVRGREISGRAAFVGGVAQNQAVAQSLHNALGLNGRLLTPAFPAHMGAVGAALLARERGGKGVPTSALFSKAGRPRGRPAFPAWEPLDLGRVTLLRDRVRPYRFPSASRPIDAYLGVDVGSVSTNLVCVGKDGELIHEIYLRTVGRPVAVVEQGLREIEALLGSKIRIRGVATTGSGRELVGELLGADAIHDEITAHKTGAFHLARRHLGCEVDTIFEIGGQDAKYIHLRDGVVVNFAMNEACAAGTGSFLDEQAEKLGIAIEGEFSELALGSRQPVKLGERCTVFMERDVGRYQKEGAALQDLVAGLAYAVVENYLNRVVRGRPIGDVIFFQGGTAYNDAVAAAFGRVLGKPVIVPPHNGVIGAYGAALLAREKVLSLGIETGFRGFRIENVARSVRSFSCGGCSNRCDIQEFTIEGRKSYWGDKCSEKYRREAKVPVQPVIPDLLELRERALEEDYLEHFSRSNLALREEARRVLEWAEGHPNGATIGFPRAMYFYSQRPFWGTYLRGLGFAVRASEGTTKALADLGVEAAVAEPCFPIQVAHGHAISLLRQGVDYLLVPNAVTAESSDAGPLHSYFCPWGQTLPFVLAANPLFQGERARLLSPTVHFRKGQRAVEAALWKTFRPFAPSRRHHRAAVALAWAAQDDFRSLLQGEGKRALETLRKTGKAGIVLAGRPYNLYDRGVNLDVPRKLRSLYGVNVIPIDFLPTEGVDIRDVNRNMYWDYGRRILQAARFTSQTPRLHILYLTNFKCGPDSYVKQFAEDAAGKPFLVLQFDGHGNDAGALTRCEAYLDSIGALRWWLQNPPSREERCTSPASATAAQAFSPLDSAA